MVSDVGFWCHALSESAINYTESQDEWDWNSC